MAEVMDLEWWIRVVEIPAWAGLLALIIRHMWADAKTASDQVASVNKTQSTLTSELARVELESARAMARAAQDLADYKLQALQTFITSPTVNEMEGRITRHIESLERKLDRVLENQKE